MNKESSLRCPECGHSIDSHSRYKDHRNSCTGYFDESGQPVTGEMKEGWRFCGRFLNEYEIQDRRQTAMTASAILDPRLIR